MLPFRMVFFNNVFLFLFRMNLQYFSPLTILVIFNEIFRNKMLVLVLLSIIKDSLDDI